MLRVSIATVMLATAIAVPCACFAQGRAAMDTTATTLAVDGDDAPMATATAATADAGAAGTASADAVGDAGNEPRSAFGKVMGVMIAALKRQSSERTHPARPVRTTRAGTPMGIEIGAAFRDGLGASSRTARLRETGTGGAAAASRAAPPEHQALRQAALAGP